MASEAFSKSSFGLYTKTVVRSPVVLWILHAQIRRRSCNDVVFIGEDFIEVKEVGKDRPLQAIAVKNDFDGRIRAAAVISNEDDSTEEDFLVKLEKERAGSESEDFPPQTLVLTLDSNDLVFIYLRTGDDGSPSFAQQTLPMPSWDRILYQPGEYLAVDHDSRALAVAANEREVILYAPKPKHQIQSEIRTGSDLWCPVSSQRPLPIEGVIQQMDFLIPPSNDEDHIVLLIIVTDQRRTKAVRIEWYYSTGLQDAQIYPGQSLESGKQVPSLLVPLPDSSFLLAMGSEVTRWEHILSGSAEGTVVPVHPREMPKFPGISAQGPLWAGWTRPRRNKAATRTKADIYLAREDGYVFWLNVSASGVLSSTMAADLNCHVGSAFASIADEDGPDILAIAGETSSGMVISIGQWSSIRRMEEMSRAATMDPDTIEILPNWASVTDMVSMAQMRPERNSITHAENVLVTSGRQPFGTMTEVRRGLELSLSILVELEGMHNVTDVWTLPNRSDGSILAVLSMPDTTRLISIPAAFDDDFEEIGAEVTSAFDLQRRTLTADISASGELIQVTQRGFTVSSSLFANFEDTWKKTFDDETAIVAASIISEMSFLVVAVCQNDSYGVRGYSLPSMDEAGDIEPVFHAAVDGRPLALHAVAFGDSITVAISIETGAVVLLTQTVSTQILSRRSMQLSGSVNDNVLCDSVIILQTLIDRDSSPSLLVVCGLRDGRLVTFTIDTDTEPIFGQKCETSIGVSSIKLVQIPSDKASACAISGASTYALTWDGQDSRSLAIDNIWATDKHHPEFEQGQVIACSQLPSASLLSSPVAAESLVMIADDNFLVGRLGRHSTAVPRQIPVSGTPNRLIYADTIKSYVCSSLVANVRMLPSSRPHSAPQEKRQVWPVIDFIPRKGLCSSFSHQMQPGERVNALLQWSYRQGNDKSYSFVLVGGSYVRHTGARRGRVTFLQCSLRNGAVAEVQELRKEVFDGDVYALTLYDEATYVACAGERIYVYRYAADDGRWSQVCLPYKLASAGIHATTETDHSGRKIIVISTQRDSVVTLRLHESQAKNGSLAKTTLVPVSMGPRADTLLNHLVLPTDSAPYQPGNIDQFVMASTKYGQLIGMNFPKTKDAAPTHHRVGKIIFEAQLPRSLTRLTLSPPAERKGNPPEGVVRERIRGTATDGSLVSAVLIDMDLWRRLSWLQRLIEWSEELSPHSFQLPIYRMDAEHGARDAIQSYGFATEHARLMTLATENSEVNDMHIDGDVLSRVLRTGGMPAVKQILHRLAQEDNEMGRFLNSRWEDELNALDEVFEVVRNLDKWM